MLKSHIDAVEGVILETSKIPANTGHSLHKGTPRETFIRKFLQEHLSERVAVGTGEIIDANSKPGEKRNQIDIVIYKRDYPRLSFGADINGFLAESVVATIEVKSLLDQEELRKASRAAKAVKCLARNINALMSAGYQPPSILSYVVAYDGPASMETVYGWLPDINAAEGIVYPNLPLSALERQRIASPSLDAVFLLGRGFMYFGNAPAGFLYDEHLKDNPAGKWVIADITRGGLLFLFLSLSLAVSGMTASVLNPLPYVKSFALPRFRFGD
jgi:hypothetical protein